MYWWWLDNAYDQTTINLDDINLIMLVIIWLLLMIEENKTTVKDIMIYDSSTNKVTVISNNLKTLLNSSASETISTLNNYNEMDIMDFHAIIKQYMYKTKDIVKKDKCNFSNLN
jgi:tRNA uridine 5-carbamoylmethylation protein Kti12